MSHQGEAPRGRGRSTYRGLRLTVTHTPEDGPSFLTLAVKSEVGGWNEWSLLFPAVRVPHRPLQDHRDVLALAAECLEGLLERG